MIIHKLLLHHLSHRDDEAFYQLQAKDALKWIHSSGIPIREGLRALDLGCGHGILGNELLRMGCDVWFADFENKLKVETHRDRFLKIDIDRDDLVALGTYDLVICSNVYEHLAKPRKFLQSVPEILNPNGVLYLSWTNWLSPWGGHEFSPFHYLGPHRGHRAYDFLFRRPRIHTPFVDLFPTYIGETLRIIQQTSPLRLLRLSPRYYPELAWITRIPILREFLTWNCALLLRRVS